MQSVMITICPRQIQAYVSMSFNKHKNWQSQNSLDDSGRIEQTKGIAAHLRGPREYCTADTSQWRRNMKYEELKLRKVKSPRVQGIRATRLGL